MNKIIGGLQSKDKRRPGFENVLEMIKSESAEIHTVMYNSLYGFIFRLKVNEEDSRYNDLAESGKFTIPQTDYILKLVLIDKRKERRLSREFKGTLKKTNVEADFISESKVQMDIYAKSIIGGNDPICPGVADVQIMSNETRDIINFLRLLVDKGQDEDVRKICSYLKTHALAEYTDRVQGESPVSVKLKLGIITMAVIPDPIGITRFHNWVVSESPYDQVTKSMLLKDAYSNAMVQTIVLFYKIGYIHHDLHGGNLIVSKFTGKTMIIDFGRVSKLGDKKSIFMQKIPGSAKNVFMEYARRSLYDPNSIFSRCRIDETWLKQFVSDYGTSFYKTIVKSVVSKLPKRLKQPDSLFNFDMKSLNENKILIVSQLLRAPIIIDAIVQILYFSAKQIKIQMKWIENMFYQEVLIMVYDKIIPYFVLEKSEEIFGIHKKYLSQYVPQYSQAKKQDITRLFSKHSFREKSKPLGEISTSILQTIKEYPRSASRSISKGKSLKSRNKKHKQTRKINSI